MSRTVSPNARWPLIQRALMKATKGETVPVEELPFEEPTFNCARCKDTAFVLEEDLRGIVSGRRCPACKSRVDADTKKNRFRYVPGAEEIPEDKPAPPEQDWRKLSGMDLED